MSISNVTLRVGEDQSFSEAASFGQTNYLEEYIHSPELYSAGDVLCVPTYRLEEVEEIVEPEKPGVPVEPYVGMMWRNSCGDRRIVVSIDEGKCEVLAEDGSHPLSWDRCISPVFDPPWSNYPRTPATPAVTRKVKKWVKIEHPEVPE